MASLISDHIAPRLMPEIEILRWRRTQVLAVQLHPSANRPHYLKREGPDGGVYVRVGSTNRRADRELIEELHQFARGEAFDEQPMPDLDSEVLDFRAASESFAPVRRICRRDLEILRASWHEDPLTFLSLPRQGRLGGGHEAPGPREKRGRSAR